MGDHLLHRLGFEFRAFIFRQRDKHVFIAAIHQFVGHGFGDLVAFRNGLQVILASANPKEIERALGPVACRGAREDGYVW